MAATAQKSWIVTSQPQVAEFFSVSLQTVHNWRAHGMPGRAKHYDLSEILLWLRSDGPWRSQLQRQIVDDDNFDDAESRSRKLRAEADWQEMRVEREAGNLVYIDDIQGMLDTVANSIRRLGEQFGRSTMPMTGREAQTLLNQTIDGIQWIGDKSQGTQPPVE